MSLLSEDFFSLKDYRWGEIFSDNIYVWDSLAKIYNFIPKEIEKNGGGDFFADENTIIQDTARIEGRALIGKNCVIGHGVLLRDGVIIGDNVSIGHGVEVKHSIILDNSSIAHLNYVGDSIIGSGVNISGGAILANFRIDKKTIRVKNGAEFIDTGLQKFGAIVGDGTIIGVNSALNPGTILGRNTIVYPLVSVKGFHPANSKILKDL